MAFFKFRKGGDTVAATAQPESVEAMRKRARQRLIGAAVLVLLGVVGFPLVFDTQPRPIAVDIPIDIPDRAKAKPLVVPAPAAVGTVASADPAPARPEAAAPAPAASSAQPVAAFVPAAPAAPADAAAARPAAPASVAKVAASAPAAKVADAASRPRAEPPKEAAKEKEKDKDGDRAKALLEGKAAPEAKAAASAAVDGRFVVQVGAFSEQARASAARQKLEKAGLKTYTHVAETKEGKRIRVRVGPFASRSEAEKAAGKVKGLDLPAAILTL